MNGVVAIVWPALGGLFLLSAIACLIARRRVFAFGLFLPAILLLGSWVYDRTHEELVKLNCAVTDLKLVKENQEHPEEAVYYVAVTALELGNYRGNLRAADIHSTTSIPDPGKIYAVEIGRRPFTGSYIKSIASLDYGKPKPKYTYVPPAKGGEFEYVFRQPPPPGVVMEQVLSEHNYQMAKIGLAFRTDRATFERIRPSNFKPVSFESFSTQGAQISAKHETRWWRSAKQSTEICGHNVGQGQGYERSAEDHFDTERAMMTWDTDGLVQYFWYGGGLRTDR